MLPKSPNIGGLRSSFCSPHLKRIMSIKLTCPVCQRSHIETHICPNCETDLSTYRMLAQLPVETPVEIEEQKTIPIWLPIGVAVLFLLLGLGLGFAGNSVIAKQQQTIPTTDISTSTPTQIEKPITSVITDEPIGKEIETSITKSCGGFNYIVRRGDSLSLIALRFYGDSNYLQLISQNNPQIQGRENFIEIGEVIFVPNRKNNCLQS